MEKIKGNFTLQSIINKKNFLLNCLIILSFSVWLCFIFSNPLKQATTFNGQSTQPPDQCSGRYIYIQNLPSKFNLDLINSCHNLSIWTDMCPFVTNFGFGLPLENTDGVFSDKDWYATNQFTLELIFHNKMKTYDCITTNSSLASAIYVPYYAGLSILRYLWGFNTTVRDSDPVELVNWIKTRLEWTRMGGRDHFLVTGRITWDFRRLIEYGDWGTNFLLMDEARNMTALIIEASPWHGNDFGIPYPTYFHPSTKDELVSWQERMRRLDRPWLFSFAGAPRLNMTKSIRSHLIEQCRSSDKCNLIECDMRAIKCNTPSSVMKVFQSSVFCLQPPGDSYTRRSVFDSMLAGCIPVFFHPGTAYIQYLWHLPKNYTNYSVFISEDEVRDGRVRVEDVLMRFNEKDVKRMREEVVSLIPRIVYGDPRSKLEGVKDAFDVAIEGVLERVKNLREGKLLGFDDEQNSWKYNLGARKGEKHEWDHFLLKQKR